MSEPEARAAALTSSSNFFIRLLELFLRLAAIPTLCAASLWVTVSNKQANDSFGKVEFSNLSALRYLVCVNAISIGYSIVSVFFACLGSFKSDWLFFILDQVAAYLTVTSGSAVGEVLYLAQEGEKSAAWSEACSYYGRFCDKIKLSLALQFVALLCFIALFLRSAYRLFSKFDAPSPLSSAKQNIGEQEVQ